jgi:hypothetical protein
MALTQAQWIAWLRSDDAARCVLVEAEAWDFGTGAVVAHRWSDVGYIDSVAEAVYLDLLRSSPGMRASLPDIFRGRAATSFGDIELDNLDGLLDGLLSKAWDRRPVRVYLGDESWQRADFVQIFGGVAVDISAPDSQRIVIKVRDLAEKLDKKITSTEISGHAAPVVFGLVANITPVLVDGGTRKYKVHDGAVAKIRPLSNGQALDGSNYTANLSDGTFTVVTNYENLTAHVAEVSGGDNLVTYSVTNPQTTWGSSFDGYRPSVLARRVLLERGGFVSGDINTSAWDLLDAAMSGKSPAGCFSPGASSAKTSGAMLDDLLTGSGCWYYCGRDGKLTAGVFKAASGSDTKVLSITDDDVIDAKDGISVDKRIIPYLSVKYGYMKNQTVLNNPQTNDTAMNGWRWDEILSNGYIPGTATNSSGQDKYLSCGDSDTLVTPYGYPNEAAAVGNSLADFYNKVRHIYKIRCGLVGLAVQLGDVVGLDVGRFGLIGGAPGLVVGYYDKLASEEVELKVLV